MTETMRKIFQIMRDNGMSQQQFANATGQDKCSVSRWVNDKRTPDIDKVEEMADGLGYDLVLVKRTDAKWVKVSRGWKCPECGTIRKYGTNYCPNCGEKMNI